MRAPPAPGPAPATAGGLLRSLGQRLGGGREAALEARLLLAHALGCPTARLLARPEAPVAPQARARAEALAARRAAGVPLAYLLGRWGFWDLELRITPAVLVPRPETERLVELALEKGDALARGRDGVEAGITVAEVGTGSGAVALALARERPRWRILATELCPEALAVARENRDALGLAARVRLLHGDACAPLAGERLDLLLANPPYVAEGDPHLAALRHEPRRALVAGPTGLELLARIARQARALLRPGGWLLLEHGAGQGEAAVALLQGLGYAEVADHPDLAGRPRVVAGRR